MIFIGAKERTSGLIRGVQICDRSKHNWKFYQSHDEKILSIKNEIVVFIRSVDYRVANLLKLNNNIIVYDLLDRPIADQHQIIKNNKEFELDWGIYINKCIDYYIVNNSLIKEKLNKLGVNDNNIFIIPHHSSNYEQQKNANKKHVKNVGYLGLDDQISYRKDIESFLNKKNVNFVSLHPNSREEVVTLLKQIDVGLIFLDLDHDLLKKYFLCYKPNTKLTNFQSFGIPTVGCDYSSFNEFGGKDAWINCLSKNDLFSNLDYLVSDAEDSINLRNKLSDNSYENAKEYHIDKIINLYFNMSEKLSQK